MIKTVKQLQKPTVYRACNVKYIRFAATVKREDCVGAVLSVNYLKWNDLHYYYDVVGKTVGSHSDNILPSQTGLWSFLLQSWEVLNHFV